VTEAADEGHEANGRGVGGEAAQIQEEIRDQPDLLRGPVPLPPVVVLHVAQRLPFAVGVAEDVLRVSVGVGAPVEGGVGVRALQKPADGVGDEPLADAVERGPAGGAADVLA
jgi:hypothetical protein